MSMFPLLALYEEYIEARKIRLNYEQFSAFVTYYPALLVAHTDGEVDEQEWSLLQSLSDLVVVETLPKDADKEEVKDYRELFFNEFRYLIDHLDQWDRKFMKALRQLLNVYPELAEAVSTGICSLANASKGICEKENTMIEYLRTELGLKDLCKNIQIRSTTTAARPARQPKWQILLTSFWIGL